jgi:serine protease Do
MSFLKESPIVRYAYGVTGALLIGGTAFSLATGPVGAQVAQNSPSAMSPRLGAPMSFADLAARLQPAVVNISTKQRVAVKQQSDPFEQFFRQFGGQVPGQQDPAPNGGQPQTREAGSLGSGFIISPDGYIVTNNHLVAGENGGTVDTVTVIMTNRKEYTARIIGRDTASDLALLKIDQPAVRQLGRFDPGARRRLGHRHRQSLWAWRHRHRRHRLGAPSRDHRQRRL